MNTRQFGRSCRKILKRHAEAILIIAFLAVDCFVSGWALTVATVAAILYVIAPAIQMIPKLDAKGQITYLKAFVKTPNFQKLTILLFWIYSIRFMMSAISKAMLFVPAKGEELPTISTALFMGAHELGPLACLTSPLWIYAGSCMLAIFLRSKLRATKDDQDLIKQRQRWFTFTQFLFGGAFVASILTVSTRTDGPAYMISNWLLASAKDANFFFGDRPLYLGGLTGAVINSQFSSNLQFIPAFDFFIVTAFSLLTAAFLFQPVQKLTSLLTAFCWRAVSPRSLQNIIEAFLEALRLKERSLVFNEKNEFLSNCVRTLVWLIACYSALLWLFGFCGGPLGYAIQSWLITSAVDAGFGTPSDQPTILFTSNFRIFLGSVIALYGTAPFAVTAAVILPCAKARKMTLNCDGISFYQGPYISLGGRQSRLWSDVKSLSLLKNSESISEVLMKFRSGGSIKFDTTQISVQDFRVLLDTIDQHADACAVDPDILKVCQTMEDKASADAASDGLQDPAVLSIGKQEFKSTVFVPFSPGDFLPGTETRVIRQLASKPLCAVYLGRDANGKMLTIKQFYLADESDETKAFEKILHREYELLSKLDHPGIAKVSTSFTVDKSTFLLIEHRPGKDLREIVAEHGARSETLVVKWAEHLCDIMIYLHGLEPAILHRDLSPDNVIVGEDGQLRLIDFGAAREFLEGITGTMIGKQCYVAPEQLRGNATTRSDVYSFGCTLYFLLTGRDPRALSQSSPASSIDCSEAIDKLIEDCTHFNEEERPQSFEELKERLKNVDRGFRLKLSPEKTKVPA